MTAADDRGTYFDPAGLKLVALLWRWRRFLVLNLLAVGVLTALVSLILPKWYRAKASILPPKDESSMLSRGAMDVLIGLGPVGFAGAGLPRSESQQLAAVLRSRSLADAVIISEGLVEHYEADTLPEARREFDANFSVSTDADGLVNVQLADRDRYKAAAVVNRALAVLDSINQNLSTSSAAATRRFVESRLDDIEDQLQRAENDLRSFQERYGTIAIEEQLAVLIQRLALLRVERMKQEMAMAVLQEQPGSDGKRLSAARERISMLDRQIGAVESSGDSAATLTAGNAPRLAMESVRLLRQLTAYEELYKFMRQALEQARIDERRDIPTFTVLDSAVPPDRKWKPKRSFIVLGSMATAFALFSVLIVWAEATRPVRDIPPVDYRGGWRRILRRGRESMEEHVG